MEICDLERILEIEEGCFPSAWPRAMFLQVLRRPQLRTLVIEQCYRLHGFAIIGPQMGVMHIWNLGIAVEARRRGLGTALLRHVEFLARIEGCKAVQLSVREGNLGAQLAYRRAGFEAIKIMHRGYGNEDAYEMRLPLSTDGDARTERHRSG